MYFQEHSRNMASQIVRNTAILHGIMGKGMKLGSSPHFSQSNFSALSFFAASWFFCAITCMSLQSYVYVCMCVCVYVYIYVYVYRQNTYIYTHIQGFQLGYHQLTDLCFQKRSSDLPPLVQSPP